MEKLTQKEINTAEEIISKGLSKAAQSLSFFMKEHISLKETDFNISSEQTIEIKKSKVEENLFVLSTEIKGELKGICFLVFDQEEKDEICKVTLPPDIINNPDKLKAMQEPLLLEIDNIISASVITQLANNLKQKVYGDVPQLTLLTPSALKENIQQQMKPDRLIIGFQTEFISSKSHFHPEFFWILEPEFLQSVKRIVVEQTN
jgi:chemotaxis protein CheY-P-specific phosphatase CheC